MSGWVRGSAPTAVQCGNASNLCALAFAPLTSCLCCLLFARRINGTLRRYQQEGINWMAFLRRFGLHGVLAGRLTVDWLVGLLAMEAVMQSLPALLAHSFLPPGCTALHCMQTTWASARRCRPPPSSRRTPTSSARSLRRQVGGGAGHVWGVLGGSTSACLPVHLPTQVPSHSPAVLAAGAAQDRPRPSLVICPPTLVAHWPFEIAKFVAPEVLRPLQYHGVPAERAALRRQLSAHDVVVMSYDALRAGAQGGRARGRAGVVGAAAWW